MAGSANAPTQNAQSNPSVAPTNEVGYRFGGGLLDTPAIPTPAPQFYDSQGNKQLGNFADNINQHIVGLNVLEGDRLAAADINGDGKVNISDTTEYLRRDTGIADWNEGQGADYYNQFYQQGDRYVDNPNAGQKRGDKYMKYEAPAGDMPVDGGNATNPLDQGRYVGNPNHGGGNGNTPFGSPPTNKQPSTLPDWMENVPRDPNLAYTTELRFDTFTDPVTGESWSGDKRDYRLRDTGLLQNPNPIMPEWTQSTAPAPTQQPTQELPPGYIPGVTALPQQEPSTPIWGAPTGYNGPTSLPTYDALLNYDYSGYNPYGTTSGMPNLGYASSQLAGTQPAGLEKQNLDYAMAQLGMMTGSSLGGGTTYPGTTYPGTSTPGFDAPYGGATPDGGYNNPFTGTDSAGRTPDDPYYGGLSDTGTTDPNQWSYGNVADYYNWGSNVAGSLFGPIGGAFADASFGINPMPGAGNYIPGTDIYNPTYLSNFEGSGEKLTDLYDIPVGEQRDMLIEQDFLSDTGMFGSKKSDPEQYFFKDKAEMLTWYNNGVTVANPGSGAADEAVGVANNMLSLEGSSFGSIEEAQAVADHGFGSDEHMAALEADGNQVAIDLLTPPTAPVATTEAPDVVGTPSPSVDTISVHPETRLPTQPTPGVDGWTDPVSGNTFYNEDHNWNEPSQSPVAPNQTPVQAPAPDTSGSDDSGSEAAALAEEAEMEAMMAKAEAEQAAMEAQAEAEAATKAQAIAEEQALAAADAKAKAAAEAKAEAAAQAKAQAEAKAAQAAKAQAEAEAKAAQAAQDKADAEAAQQAIDDSYGDTDISEGTEAGDYAEAGFTQEEADFAQSFDDDSGSEDAAEDAADDGGWGDWGGGDNFGFE